MRNLKYFLSNETKHKSRVHQLYFIGVFLQAKLKNRVFVKLDSRYADYFSEYSNYFRKTLRLLKSMYGMTNSVGKTLVDYKHGRPLPVLPRIRSRLPRGIPLNGVPRGGVPRNL